MSTKSRGKVEKNVEVNFFWRSRRPLFIDGQMEDISDKICNIEKELSENFGIKSLPQKATYGSIQEKTQRKMPDPSKGGGSDLEAELKTYFLYFLKIVL